MAAMLAYRIEMHDDLLRATFKRFDTDDSGFITSVEVKKLLGDSYKKQEVERLMKEADLDGDGRICVEEFIGYLRGGDLSKNQLEVVEAVIEVEVSARKTRARDFASHGDAAVPTPTAPLETASPPTT